MHATSLAILGAGNVQFSPAVLGALGSYYGERPLEIRLCDADFERLDLFDRLARVVLSDSNVEHHVRSTVDPEEALEGASRVVLQVDENCARQYAKQRGLSFEGHPLDFLIPRLVHHVGEDALVLSLLDRGHPVGLPAYYRLDGIGDSSEEALLKVPLQVMRWIRREEPIYELIDPHERSPIKKWLDDPTTADFVVGQMT